MKNAIVVAFRSFEFLTRQGRNRTEAMSAQSPVGLQQKTDLEGMERQFVPITPRDVSQESRPRPDDEILHLRVPARFQHQTDVVRLAGTSCNAPQMLSADIEACDGSRGALPDDALGRGDLTASTGSEIEW